MPVAYEGRYTKRILTFFVLLNFATSVLLIITHRPIMRVGKIVQSEVFIAPATRKHNMKPKFFLKISGHQLRVSRAPSSGPSHTANSAGGR
jgi:hypothetical protein